MLSASGLVPSGTIGMSGDAGEFAFAGAGAGARLETTTGWEIASAGVPTAALVAATSFTSAGFALSTVATGVDGAGAARREALAVAGAAAAVAVAASA